MIEWIRDYNPQAIVVATKEDKLKKSEIEGNLELIWNTLELTEDDILVPFSIKNDEGKFTVWDIIEMILAGEKQDS